MNIYPINNIIDSVYRPYNNFRYTVSINIHNSIFETLLLDNQYINFLRLGNSIDYLNYVHSTINLNAHVSSDYLNHFQNKRLFDTYHIKDFVLFLDPPLKILKKEDIILVKNRLQSTQKVCITDQIAKRWSGIKALTIEPGIKPCDLDGAKRKDIIILSYNDKMVPKIYQALQNKYKNVHVVHAVDNYNSIMNTLKEYKVCINLGISVDSLYAQSAGCVVISKDSIYNDTYELTNIQNLVTEVGYHLDNYDFEKQKQKSLLLINNYNYEKFEQNMSKYIIETIMEPFTI